MRRHVRDFLQRLHLLEAARAVAQRLREARRWVKGVDGKVRRDYAATTGPRKLHIGCGGNVIEGWLNTDYQPRIDAALHLDATRRFPFDEASFDYVFSEHMIEHVAFDTARAMLCECRRVLKPGGRIRISTPDLRFLAELHRAERSGLQADYLRWSVEAYLGDAAKVPEAMYPALVINNFVRDWGHLFIHDEATLGGLLDEAGFVSIDRCPLNESEDPELRDLENPRRMPEGFLALESFTLEAVRP